jgi:hypothetical protein
MYTCPSFDDLFEAARGRPMRTEESERFARLTQSEKNAAVRKLVGETGGSFRCYDVVGKDGITYTAFERPGD